MMANLQGMGVEGIGLWSASDGPYPVFNQRTVVTLRQNVSLSNNNAVTF